MSKDTRKLHIDENDYSFNFSVFNRFFNSYKSRLGKNVTDTEQLIADALGLSREAVHSWRFEKNGPADVDIIKNLAEFLGIIMILPLLILQTFMNLKMKGLLMRRPGTSATILPVNAFTKLRLSSNRNI